MRSSSPSSSGPRCGIRKIEQKAGVLSPKGARLISRADSRKRFCISHLAEVRGENGVLIASGQGTFKHRLARFLQLTQSATHSYRVGHASCTCSLQHAPNIEDLYDFCISRRFLSEVPSAAHRTDTSSGQWCRARRAARSPNYL